MSAASAAAEVQVVRQLADFPPSLWAHHFASFSSHTTSAENVEEEIKGLKEEVRVVLVDETIDPMEKMIIIDSINRLGVSYHFAKEIDGQLENLFEYFFNNGGHDHDHEKKNCKECDLFAVSLQFRIFRQRGYRISCDVFNKFKDSTGKFRDTLASDVKGILSLYEATQLRIRGEDSLDEAFVFTATRLEKMVSTLDPPLLGQVTQALHRPLHKGMPRIEARLHISSYEEDETHNASLLKLAKVDFNFLQKMHQQELNLVSKWWKDLGFAEKVSYARDRIVECYFWILGVYFEPCYSVGRIILAKIVTLLALLDDTYDAFGTLNELTLFTDAVNKWDLTSIDQLPDSMQFFCRVLVGTYDEIDEQMTQEGRSYSVHQAKEAMKEVARAYYHEAVWFNSGYKPTFDEYMEVALASSAQAMMLASAFVGMPDVANKEAFDWLQTRPKNVKALQRLGRLHDDIMSREFEQRRGHVPSAVECYVKQYGISEKEAIDELQKQIEDAWKDINEECLKPTEVSMDLLMAVVNLTRMIDVMYRYGDAFTNPELLKDYITLLFIEPVFINI